MFWLSSCYRSVYLFRSLEVWWRDSRDNIRKRSDKNEIQPQISGQRGDLNEIAGSYANRCEANSIDIWWDVIEVDATLITTTMNDTGVSSNAGTGPSRQQQPQKPPAKNLPVVTPGSGNNIIVNQRQASTPQSAKAPILVKLTVNRSGKTPCSNV